MRRAAKTRPEQESSEAMLLATGAEELKVLSLALFQTAKIALGPDTASDITWHQMLISADAVSHPATEQIQHLHFFHEEIQRTLELSKESFDFPSLGVIDRQDLLLMYLRVMPVLRSDNDLAQRFLVDGLREDARRVNENFQRLQVFLVSSVGYEDTSQTNPKRGLIRKAADAWKQWVTNSFPSDEEASFKPDSRYGRFMSSTLSSPRSRFVLRAVLLSSCCIFMVLVWTIAFAK